MQTLFLLLCAALPGEARLVRMAVENREPASLAGTRYERLTGHLYGELDPTTQLNAVLNDILLAPRNRRGMVEYSATFTLLRPVESSSASGVLWYEVPNRGNSPLNPSPARDGLLGGHILVSSGWQGDLVPRAGLETISAPIARNADGSSITGPVLYRISNVRGQTASLQAGYAALRYQTPSTLDTSKALLTKQASDDGQIIPIPSSDWAFANCEKAPRRVLKLIRAFLQAGVMEGGLVSPVDAGTPQGGPLSPLLSNIVLDEFDRELERRGLRLSCETRSKDTTTHYPSSATRLLVESCGAAYLWG